MIHRAAILFSKAIIIDFMLINYLYQPTDLGGSITSSIWLTVGLRPLNPINNMIHDQLKEEIINLIDDLHLTIDRKLG